MTSDTTASDVRLDVWLDVACLFRTRSEAQKACKGGKVAVNGHAATPHRLVRPGDEIRITRPFGRRQIVVVRALADRHIPKAQARDLYDDRTPLPTPEEATLGRLERAYRMPAPPRAPDKRERRLLRQLKGRG